MSVEATHTLQAFFKQRRLQAKSKTPTPDFTQPLYPIGKSLD
jgi:hypothetical protein